MAKKPKLGWIVKGQQFYFNGFPLPPQQEPEDPILCEIDCLTIEGKIHFYVLNLAKILPYEMSISDFAKMVDEGWIQVRTY